MVFSYSILSGQAWVIGALPSQLVDHAYRLSSNLWDDPEVVEFASLGSQIRVLGQ